MALLGPISSALGGITLGFLADQLVVYAMGSMLSPGLGIDEKLVEEYEIETIEKKSVDNDGMIGTGAWADAIYHQFRKSSTVKQLKTLYRNPLSCLVRLAVGAFMLMSIYPKGVEFFKYSHQMAEGMSGPSIMFKARLKNGQERCVYRIMGWWCGIFLQLAICYTENWQSSRHSVAASYLIVVHYKIVLAYIQPAATKFN